MTFTFEIDFATDKDTLSAGEVVAGTVRVTVLGDSPESARLVADQMVAATGREPTAARLIRITI